MNWRLPFFVFGINLNLILPNPRMASSKLLDIASSYSPGTCSFSSVILPHNEIAFIWWSNYLSIWGLGSGYITLCKKPAAIPSTADSAIITMGCIFFNANSSMIRKITAEVIKPKEVSAAAEKPDGKKTV